MEEFAQGDEGVCGLDGAAAVDGLVAEFADDVEFGVQGGADEGFEAGVEQQGAEVAFVGRGEVTVAFVEPVEGEFEGAAAVEAGGTRVGVGEGFGFGGGFVEFRPFGLEKLKVNAGGTHGGTTQADGNESKLAGASGVWQQGG